MHEQSSNSDLTRKGRARAFLFTDKDRNPVVPSTGQWVKEPLPVNAASMVDAFENGFRRFRSFIEKSERRDSILARCVEWFDYRAKAAGVASED